MELGLTPAQVEVDAEMLHGGTRLSAFWQHTLDSARHLCLSEGHLTDHEFEAALSSLNDPSMWTPFLAVVCVTARMPKTTDQQIVAATASMP
jgi:hypothetical protein